MSDYTVASYGSMIVDQARMVPFVEALKRHVTPDSVVFDIGAGTGIFALLACQFGARRVYAIEPNDAIQTARVIASANGFAERIHFIQDLSTKLSLPDQADIIISDMRGTLPLYDHHISSIIDARTRLLKPGGVLIPQKDVLSAAVVAAPKLYNDYVQAWDEFNYGLNMEAARWITVNDWGKGRPEPEHLLTTGKVIVELDYRILERVNLSSTVTWEVEKAGVANGICVWFDMTTADGLGFCNAPGWDKQTSVYGSAFFPLERKVNVDLGDIIVLQLNADLVGDDYVWRWETQVNSANDKLTTKAHYKQSTFNSAALSPKQLRKRADNFVPRRNEKGEIDQFILSRMDGAITQGEIALLVSQRWPQHFATTKDALTHIAALSAKYCN